MRRLLRDIATGRAPGDPSASLRAGSTTLADPSVLESLKSRYAEDSE